MTQFEYIPEPGTDWLRLRLRLLTESTPRSDIAGEIAKLSWWRKHGIRALRDPYPNLFFSCFAFALGIAQDAAYQAIRSGGPDFPFAGVAFVQWLIKVGVLRRTPKRSRESLVIYFRDGMPSHAGLMRDGRVKSKWGQGLLYSHRMWEVPTAYGEKVRLYELVEKGVALKEFLRFAKFESARLRQRRKPIEGEPGSKGPLPLERQPVRA